ncbi:carboxylating nicotinate-nucleotide diphosphorylase [Serpentinicella sp. ANB-PHB4]|uniref:carboxylating nicotinate-nucleotide diphosphorylase n=1 Tax=Serpentinicella sp. ANB-PHB4 TaxID=3074076 RepID=UPI002865F523|nr:carboxylating nicotinate-nucleotide diphosphorylase [Serpentinicella sp. ANB-PHB4]MDR5659497.1 carboxylating nicotinate-nucleotide diphosphorylase [Serpentinicella sp. ANB-PHB4]
MYNPLVTEDIIKLTLKEDINFQDITTDTLIDPKDQSCAKIIAKEVGVFAGGFILEQVYSIIDNSIEVEIHKNDGERIDKGDKVATIKGCTKNILKGERTALNFMQRMSGIATKSGEYAVLVKDLPVKIVDTRKTAPTLRVFDKYAVKVGGCFNHRFNLSDGVLIKDNHIAAVGSIKEAIHRSRKALSHTVKIEVEVQNLQQFEEAIEAKVDIIMLDNMSVDMMKQAVKINKGRAILEASGNISLNNVREVASTGVDIISVGELTHSVKALDLSMLIDK